MGIEIRPGDCLLYSGSGLWSFLIKLKTWSPVSHVEVALNQHFSLASRDGEGTNLYEHRAKGLYAVLRPRQELDWAAGMAWFASVRGQPYSYWQGLRFFRLGKENVEKTMCSPFATRFYRAAGLDAFAPGFDASLVSPGMFLSSPSFDVVWLAE